MEKGKTFKDKISELPKQVKKILQGRSADAFKLSELSPEETHRLIHELLAYQNKLELQNEELRRAQRQVEAIRDKYSDLYDFAPFGYFTVSEEGLVMEANLTGASLLGMERRCLIRKPLSHFITRESRNIYYAYSKKLFGTKAPQICELKLVKKDGTEFYAQLEGIALHDFAGNFKCFRTAMINISARKETERSRQMSEKKYSALVENSPDILYILDSEGRFRFVGGAIKKLLGFTADELIGKHFTSIIHSDDIEKAEWRFNERRTGDRATKGLDIQLSTKDLKKKNFDIKYLPVELHAFGVYNEPVSIKDKLFLGTYGAARDITERKLAEKQIRNLTQQLMKAQEIERQMISRELHDSVAQDLSFLKIACDRVFDDQVSISPETRQRFSKFSRILQKTIISIRNLVYGIRPLDLDELEFVQTVFKYCEDFSNKNKIDVNFNSAGLHNLKLNYDIKINLYRIIQECLNNINKHANASRVTIRMVAAFPNIILRIEDDGRGFEVKNLLVAKQHEKCMGLRSIEERASLLGGKMVIESRPMHGTKVFIKIPYKEESNGSKENDIDS